MADTKAMTVEVARARLQRVRHCVVLGMTVVEGRDGRAILELPYSEKIIGNPETGVIAGGALTTVLDTACGYAVAGRTDKGQISTTMDLRIDYMKPAKPGKSVYGVEDVYRLTDNVVFTRGKAYQDNPDEPVAHCVATFMRLPLTPDTTFPVPEAGE